MALFINLILNHHNLPGLGLGLTNPNPNPGPTMCLRDEPWEGNIHLNRKNMHLYWLTMPLYLSVAYTVIILKLLVSDLNRGKD